MDRLQTKARLRAEFAREDQAILKLTGITGRDVAREWISSFAPRLSLIAIKNILFRSRHVISATRGGFTFADAMAVAGLSAGEARHEAIPSFTKSEWCARAEPYFVDLLGQVLIGAPAEQLEVSVYHDSHGEALAMRKRVAVASALTLLPLAYNGVVLPAGTLIGVGREANNCQTGQHQVGRVSYRTFEVDGLAVNPMRFTPWAFPEPEDRAMFGCDTFANRLVWYNADRANSLTTTSINDFQRAAGVIMAMCDPRPESVVV